MQSNSDFLVEIYVQCNEHLREQARKRDVLLASFVAVCGGALALLPPPETDPALRTGILSGIIALGILVGVVQTFLRCWHMIYIFQAQLVQALLLDERAVLDSEALKRLPVGFRSIFGVEFFMFLALHAILGVFLWLQLASGAPLLAGLFGLACLFEFSSHFVALRVLDGLKSTGRFPMHWLWMLHMVGTQRQPDVIGNGLREPLP